MASSDRESVLITREKVTQQMIDFCINYPNRSAIEVADLHAQIMYQHRILLDHSARPLQARIVQSTHAARKQITAAVAGEHEHEQHAHKAAPKRRKDHNAARAKSEQIAYEVKSQKYSKLTQPEAIMQAVADKPGMTVRELATFVAENGLPFTTKNILSSITTAVGTLYREGVLKGVKELRGNKSLLTFKLNIPKVKAVRASA